MTQSATVSATFTVTDIEKVVRRVKADFLMIAESTGGWTVTEAQNYVHDIELLTKEGYLSYADLTLLSDGAEVKASRFNVNEDASGLTGARPGDAMWPKVSNPKLRLVLGHTTAYTDDAKKRLAPKLKIGWTASYEDISHAKLTSSGQRDYVSNSYGIQRKDWSK